MAIGDPINRNARHVDALQIILIIAGVFAIAAVGFFVAVFIGETHASPTTAGTIHVDQVTSDSQKQQLLQQLQGSSDTNATTTTGNTSGSSTTQTQSSATDSSGGLTAAQKQKLLQSLNGN